MLVLIRKITVWVVIFWTAIGSGAAQTPDTLYLSLKNSKKITRKIELIPGSNEGFNLWGDRFKGHWSGLDLGFNTLTGPDFTNQHPALMSHNLLRSNSFGINLIQKSIGFQSTRNTLGLVAGAGLELKAYHLDKNSTLSVGPLGKIDTKILVVNQNQKSKLAITYLKIPLLIEFQIPVNHYQNRIFFSAGIYGAYRLGSVAKIKYQHDATKEKFKTPDDFSLRDMRTGFMVRIGYRQLQFFAERDHSPLFRKEAMAPNLYPFTFGLTLLRF